MEHDKVPDLLPNEIDTEEIIHKNFWKRLIKDITRMIKRFKINTKLFRLGQQDKKK